MEEEIRIHLQQIEDLRVKSRTAVENYRDKTPDIKTIEEDLGVAYFLEGSVNKVGDIISIKVFIVKPGKFVSRLFRGILLIIKKCNRAIKKMKIACSKSDLFLLKASISFSKRSLNPIQVPF